MPKNLTMLAKGQRDKGHKKGGIQMLLKHDHHTSYCNYMVAKAKKNMELQEQKPVKETFLYKTRLSRA